MDKKTFSTTTSSSTSSQNKNLTTTQQTTANGSLTVDQLDIEILPTIYEIIRW